LNLIFAAPKSFSLRLFWRPAYDIAEFERRMFVDFRPLHDRGVVRRIDAQERTAAA
jgi:hypothetical protein